MPDRSLPTQSDVVLIARCPEHGLHGERQDCFVCGGPVEQVAMAPVADHGEFVLSEDALVVLVAAIRAADEVFQSGRTGGGGTRHYVRDCLLPEFERRGIRVVLSDRPTDA